MHVYVCVYVCVCTYVCIYIYVCMYIYVYMYIEEYVYTYVYKRTTTYACVGTGLYRHTLIHVSTKQNYITTDTSVSRHGVYTKQVTSVPTYIVIYLFITYARTYTHTHTYTYHPLSPSS